MLSRVAAFERLILFSYFFCRWQHVLEYSKQILSLFEGSTPSPDGVIADPMEVMKVLFKQKFET